MRGWMTWVLCLLTGLAVLALPWQSAPGAAAGQGENEWQRVLLMRDYNTRVVVLGAALLGVAAGVIGSFALLRKRALMGDALSHAMLPGIGLAFMISSAAGGTGKNLAVLLTGAAVTGLLGLGSILVIRNYTRLKEDTALGIVLSVFFGGGVAILGVAQRTGEGHAAGLESFIYGKTASMLGADAWMIGLSALLVIICCSLLFKQFTVLCFDNEFCDSIGWRSIPLDVVMMTMVVIVTVIGLQAVGLILVIAMLIIPPAAARFWTEHLRTMVIVSAGIGALAGAGGSILSAMMPDLPSGAMIVLFAAGLFATSMVFGTRRGVLPRALRRRGLSIKVRRQHLLRAAFELIERETGQVGDSARQTSRAALLKMRSWSTRQLDRALKLAADEGLLFVGPDDGVTLTPPGVTEARRLVRNHRLWELFLITHADVAPSHVDRDADAIEHVLGPDLIRELENLLEQERPSTVPQSPHLISSPASQPA